MAEGWLVEVRDRSTVSETRRRAVEVGASTGLGSLEVDRLALIVTELGTNLVKHAGGGDLVIQPVPGSAGVDVLAIDRGPGMDVDRCLQDGHSTAGSAGTGLGAVRRLASLFDAYAARPGGTVILARMGREQPRAHGWEVGAVCLPKRGQGVCGDAWAAVDGNPDSYAMMVADGLGHGMGAADAARIAERLFRSAPRLEPAAQIAAIHGALRGTRGAAVAVARVNGRVGTVAFAGIGNISGAIVSGGITRQLVSMHGTAGHEVPRINQFNYPWGERALLLMHSDGLATRWDLRRYPGLLRRHPAVVAGVLLRDHSRGRDDVTVVAARPRAA